MDPSSELFELSAIKDTMKLKSCIYYRLGGLRLINVDKEIHFHLASFRFQDTVKFGK